MRAIMPWCRVVLVQRLSTDEKFNKQFVETEFWRERPLQIAVANNDAGLVGFKPPWQKAQCLTAIDQRRMYEAAINIDWLGTISASADDHIIAGDEVTFADVERIRSTSMIIDDDVLDTVQKSEDLLVEQRKHFTFAFACHTPDASHLDKDGFRHELVLLDGHAFVWAWWLHLFYLLLSAPASSRRTYIALRHHLDMGLSLTAQVRAEKDPAKLAAWSAERAGTQEFVAEMGADTFPSFVRKANLIMKDVPQKNKEQHFKSLKILYDGSPVNRKMFYAMQSCYPLIAGPASAVLTAIQNEFGKRVIAKGYTKLYDLCRLCNKLGKMNSEKTNDLTAQEMFCFILEGLLFEMRYGITAPDTLSGPALTGTKGKKDNGRAGILLWKLIIWRWWKHVLRNAASSATEGLQKDINELISKFDSWQTFADFHKKEVSNGEADELNKFERWKAERKKVIRDLADFLHDLFGEVHDIVLEKIPLEDHKDPFSVDWGNVIKVCENIARNLRKRCGDNLQHRRGVSAAADGSPRSDPPEVRPRL